ncbi:MAG: hypothetical protein ABIW32_02775 [Terrimesophilobacter sp.]
MIAVLSELAMPFAMSLVPFVTTLVTAASSLVIIGVVVRRLRVQGKLSLDHASISAAAASFVLAVALLASASLGVSPSATAVTPTAGTQETLIVSPVPKGSTGSTDAPPSDGFEPIPLDGLEGFQLPTE